MIKSAPTQSTSGFKTVIFAVRLMLLLLSLGFCGVVGGRIFSGPFEPPDCYDLDLGGEIESCAWRIEIDEEGERIMIELQVNGLPAADIELEIIELHDDYLFAEAPYQKGWSGYIRVVEPYRRRGLGTKLWRIGDEAIRHTYGSGQVRVYINASDTRFGSTIRRQVMPVFATADGDFIYIVR